MHPSVRNTLILLLGVMGLFVGFFVYKMTNPGPPSHSQLRNYGYFSFEDPRLVKDIHLIDHLQHPIDINNFKGKTTLIFFGFTSCPDVCPTTLSVLNHAMTKTETKPQVVMISVDPERDTPAKLASYVPAFNKDFIGITGEFDEIVNIATQLNVAFGKVPGTEPGTYEVNHSGSIALLDAEGRYAGFFRLPHRAENISTVLNLLKSD